MSTELPFAGKCSEKVLAWANTATTTEEKPVSIRFVIDGYMPATAVVKPGMSPKGAMFITNIGRNNTLETDAKKVFEEQNISIKECRGGGILAEVTSEQLQAVLATGKFRKALLSSEITMGVEGR